MELENTGNSVREERSSKQECFDRGKLLKTRVISVYSLGNDIEETPYSSTNMGYSPAVNEAKFKFTPK